MPPLAQRIAAALSATLCLVATTTARADDQPPNTFSGHGITFSYPGSWIEIPATFEVQVGTPLWTESVGPVPQVPTPAPPQPTPTPTPTPTPPPPAAAHPDLVTVAAYHVSVALTKKNIGRYKPYIAAAVTQLVAQAHGQVLSGPMRVNVARLPGYSFQVTIQMSDGTMIASRIVFIFRKKTEYFLNCEYPQNDPLGPEIDAGCTQVMQSFRLGS